MEAQLILDSQSTTDNQSIEDFYRNRDRHFYALPTQRNYVWDNERQSLFIFSLIVRFPIGQLCVHENNNVDEFMDGQQRARTIEYFLSNKFKLSEDTPNVLASVGLHSRETKEFVIARKTYDELDQEIKQRLLTRMIRIERFRNLPAQVINSMMAFLNNQKPLTTIERTRMIAHGDLQTFVNNLANSEFFKRKAFSTKATKNSFTHDKEIYQILIYETGLVDTSYSETNLENFVNTVRKSGGLSDEVENRVISTIDYMTYVFPQKERFINMNNMLPLYFVVQEAMQDNIEPRVLYDKVLKDFMSSIPEEYNNIKGNWNSKSATSKRIKFMMDYYKEYIK